MADGDSLEGSYEHIDMPPSFLAQYLQCPDVPIDRNPPLTTDQYLAFLDRDGRVTDEHGLRKAVFKGGVEKSIRSDVWQFIFGLYPFSSTKRERMALKAEASLKYEALKHRWKTLLLANAAPGEPNLVVADYRTENEKKSHEETRSIASDISLSQNSLAKDSENSSTYPSDSEEDNNTIAFLKIQAKVFAERQDMDISCLLNAIRIIDKDVPRTDRELEYYRIGDSPHLQSLRNILVTYSCFHARVGYGQGMNDVAARFLLVLDSEAAAYWCFDKYMTSIQDDFIESSMSRNLNLLSRLIGNLDADLYNKLEKCECADLLFCHRWLLLSFKREFSWEDGIRIFEILSSHHLELNSEAARSHLEKERWREFEREKGVNHATEAVIDTNYTFDLFVCAAILIDNRAVILSQGASDPAEMFILVNSLAKDADLDDILRKSEALFYIYCKKAVSDCFQVVDGPAPPPTSGSGRR